MADKSKFFRVAIEGGTTDGRIIERAWLEEMAATYVPATYGARVNMEHIKGYSADKPFCAYGDVLALKTEVVEIELAGKKEKRLALFAQINPTAELLEINARKQKIYTSIEVNPNFAGTGKAYLMGVAVTDTPASLGTEMLEFAAKSPAIKAMFDGRKTSPDCLFTAAIETAIELEPAAADTAAGGSLTEFLKGVFSALGVTSAVASTAPVNPALAATPSPSPGQGGVQLSAADQVLAGQLGQFQRAIEGLGGQIDKNRTADQAAFTKLQGEFTSLKTTMDQTPGFSAGGSRPLASGGAGVELTDC